MFLFFPGESIDIAAEQQSEWILRESAKQCDYVTGARPDSWRRNGAGDFRQRTAWCSPAAGPRGETSSRQLRLVPYQAADPVLAGRVLPRRKPTAIRNSEERAPGLHSAPYAHLRFTERRRIGATVNWITPVKISIGGAYTLNRLKWLSVNDNMRSFSGCADSYKIAIHQR